MLPIRVVNILPIYPPKESAEAFRGYAPSKRCYFYGLRVHLVVSEAGEPMEFALEAGSEAGLTVVRNLGLDLPEGSTIFADKDYTGYDYEDLLKQIGSHLKAQRRKNSKRPISAWEEFLEKPIRQHAETGFSRLARRLLNSEGRHASFGHLLVEVYGAAAHSYGTDHLTIAL